MSTTLPSGDSTPVRANNAWILTTAGVAVIAAIFFAVNWFFSLSSANLDFTEHKVHTLSEGTEKILKRIDTDVTIKLYVSPTDDLMPQFRPVVGQIEGWLQRYHEMQPEFVKIQKFVVEPASDEEQDAATTGIQPQRNQFFGIAITSLDKTSLIPWAPALMAPFVDQDRIEFGLSAGITEVTSQKKKVVGLMTPLQMTGNAMPFGGRGQPAWAIYEAIKSQYEVKTIELTTTNIDPTIDVLLMIHPAGITDEAQWAVDQYLLGGGRVVAFLDSYNLIASQSGQQQPGMPPGMSPGAIPASSNLSKLLGAWGYTYEGDKIVADMSYSTQMGPGSSSPLLLTLGNDGVKKDSEVTKQLSDFWFIFTGAYTGSPASGLTEKVLLTTSAKNQLVDTSNASANPGSPQGQQQVAALIRNFKPEGKERLLALELSGKFKTAFPEGKPAPPPPPPPGGPGGGMGGMPPGMNFGGPQGEEGTPGAAAPAAPAETKPADPAPAAPPAAAPATAPPAAAPAAPATAPAAPSAAPSAPPPGSGTVTPPFEITTKPVEIPKTEATTPPLPVPPVAPTVTPNPTLIPAPAAVGAAPGTPPADAPPPTEPGLLPPPATAPGSPAIPVAHSADPNSPAPLKESSKDGLVFLVSDADMIADVLTPQILQNSNLPFALNLVDQAAGDKDLMSIRSRGSSRRPFATLNDIREEANKRIQGDVESMNKEVEELNKTIQSQKTGKDRNNALFAGLKTMEAKQRDISKRIYEKQKEANKEVKAKENSMQWLNILLMPGLIAGLGLVVFILRKVKTSAR